VKIRFADPLVGRRCNSAAAIEREWGAAGADVRESLCVLHGSPTSAAYEAHPNVTTEGDKTVFKGHRADVMLDLTENPGPPPEVVVDDVDVRDHLHAR
jgi:hypothetical protein